MTLSEASFVDSFCMTLDEQLTTFVIDALRIQENVNFVLFSN